jgi:hypothetical protein
MTGIPGNTEVTLDMIGTDDISYDMLDYAFESAEGLPLTVTNNDGSCETLLSPQRDAADEHAADAALRS